MKTQLQKRIFDYLRTVEKASPRKVARELGESRHRVKQALYAMTEAGVLENLKVSVLIPEDVFKEMFLSGAARRVRRISTSTASKAASKAATAAEAPQTEVRRV